MSQAIKNNPRTIFSWALYDWANSVFVTTVVAVVLPAFFANAIVPEGGYELFGRLYEGDTLWAYLRGGGAFIFFLMTPVLGAIADFSGSKRRFLMTFAYGGSVFASLLYFVGSGDVLLTMGLFFVAQMGLVGSTVFYDGFLPNITTDDTIDRVSARGYATGYLGGGIHLALSLFLLEQHQLLGLDRGTAVSIVLATAGLWWMVFSLLSLPRLPETGVAQALPERYSGTPRLLAYSRLGLGRTWQTARHLRHFPQLLLFLVAYMVYNDGVQTINIMTSSYATVTLKLTLSTIVLAFLAAQITAFPGALAFAWLAQRISARRAVLISLAVWSCLAVGAYYLTEGSVRQFMVLATVAGFVQGGTAALSRSLYGSMIPEEASAEFYGFYSVFSKFSAIWGPLLFGVIKDVTGSGRLSILSVVAFFIVGAVLLAKVDVGKARASRDRWSFEADDVAHGDVV